MTVRWTRETVLGLGVVADLERAGSIFGIGRTKSYELARSGQFPVPVLRIGSVYKVPTAPIIALLGLTPDMDVAGATTPANAADTTDNGSPHDNDKPLRAVQSTARRDDRPDFDPRPDRR